MSRVRSCLIEVFEWMKELNKEDLDNVAKLSNQEITLYKGFKLDRFKFKKEIGNVLL